MILHTSFAARNPRQAATAIAGLMGGTAMRSSGMGRATWIAVWGDGDGAMIEIYAEGEELQPAPEGAVAARAIAPRRFSATHIAVATHLEEADVFALADREGWLARRTHRGKDDCRIGDGYGVIEVWIENRLLVEVLTPPMQRDYRRAMLMVGAAQAPMAVSEAA